MGPGNGGNSKGLIFAKLRLLPAVEKPLSDGSDRRFWFHFGPEMLGHTIDRYLSSTSNNSVVISFAEGRYLGATCCGGTTISMFR